MNDEIEALYRNKTWTITDFPMGRKAIGSKWIFKIKYKASMEIKRYKARLVAKRYSHREGFDYNETFSLVVKMVIVRCLISIAFMNGWSLYQLDINNSFLYGDLVEDVYMNLPLGYDQGSSVKVCMLNKFLYGLKQALRLKRNGSMFTDEHAPDYSSPPIFDVYDDDFLEVESDADNVYDDPFDSKGEKIKESKLLIDELDLPCDFLPYSDYDSFNSQDFPGLMLCPQPTTRT
nr:ribonuclease H-like domain-containing protein [Tanacetum cinerariifolium]